MRNVFFLFLVYLIVLPSCYRKTGRNADSQGGIDETPIHVAGGQGGGFFGVGGEIGEAGTAGGDEPNGGLDQGMGGQMPGGQVGGEEVIGGQITGGQAGGAGGVGEPARNLQYAPQVWRPDQTKLDLKACGDVPLSTPEFEPVYHPGFDEVDPDTNEPTPSHWYAQVYASRVNHTRGSLEISSSANDVAFLWTAPSAGYYTFRSDYLFRSGAYGPLQFARSECDRPETELFMLYGDGVVPGRNSLRNRQTPTVFMEAQQTLYLFLQVPPGERPLTVHVYRSDEQTAPVIVEAQARRDAHTRRVTIFFKAFDPNQDISEAEFELLEAQGGEATPIFENGDQTWISYLEAETFTQDPSFIESYPHLHTAYNFREANGYAFVYPPPTFAGEPAYVRLRIYDEQNNVSNIVEMEIADGNAEDERTNGYSMVGQPCVYDAQCNDGFCKDIEGSRQCVEQSSIRIDSMTVLHTDDQIRMRMVAEDAVSGLVKFDAGFVEDDGEVEVIAQADASWGSNAVINNHFSSEGQTLFELRTSLLMGDEDASQLQSQVRIFPKSKLGYDVSRSIEGLDDPWIDTNIEEMPMVQIGEGCDPHQYQNVCVYGTACMEQVNGSFICEEASVPTVTSVRAVWNERLEKLSLDLEGQGDVLGYRLRGFSQIEPDHVFILGHTELSEGQFQSHAEYRYLSSFGSFRIPEEAWVEVISRQGYSSLPFQFEVEEIAGEDPCALIDCLEGHTCEDHPWILGEARCVEVPAPLPDPPTIESLVFRYDPEKKMAWVEGTGQTNVEGETYRLSLLIEDENGASIGSISFETKDQEEDPERFSFSVYRRTVFDIDPRDVIEVRGRISHEPPYIESFGRWNYSEFVDGVFEVIPVQQVGDLCDLRGYENSCPRGSSCSEQGLAEARCVDDANGCQPNRLSAHINAWESPDDSSPMGVRWQAPPMASTLQYEPQRILNGMYENNCNQGAIYSFTAPSDGVYRFAVQDWSLSDGRTYHDGFHFGISSTCNAPSANTRCETRNDGTFDRSYSNREIDVERFPECVDAYCANTLNHGYQYQSALYPSLDAGQTVYLYVDQIIDPVRSMFGMYTVSVDAYRSAPIVRAQEEGSHTKATFDSESRRAVIRVEISDLGSNLDLVHTMLEYQFLDAEDNPIALATLGGGDQAEDTWLIPLRQLPRTPTPNAQEPFVANTSAITPPVAADRLDDIAGFRVWLLSDEGIRSEPIDIQIENPELVQEERDCDPYGFYNRCPDGLLCMDLSYLNQCEDHPDFVRRAEEFGCYAPSQMCPQDACPAEWEEKLIDLNAEAQPEDTWSRAETLRAEHPNTVEYALGSYCSVSTLGNHHVFAFTATEPGRYRANLSNDTIASTNSRFQLSVRDACTRAETDLGCSLEDSHANPEDREFSTRLYRRQYGDEPFLIQPIRTNTNRETVLDLHQNQTIYLFVSASDSLIEDSEIPYQLMLERL